MMVVVVPIAVVISPSRWGGRIVWILCVGVVVVVPRIHGRVARVVVVALWHILRWVGRALLVSLEIIDESKPRSCLHQQKSASRERV